VHEQKTGTGGRNDARKSNAPHARDVVDEGCSGFDARPRDIRLSRVDRDEGPPPNGVSYDVEDALELLARGNRGSAGARGLATNIDDVCTVRDELVHVRLRVVRGEIPAPVAEGIRRDVANPHERNATLGSRTLEQEIERLDSGGHGVGDYDVGDSDNSFFWLAMSPRLGNVQKGSDARNSPRYPSIGVLHGSVEIAALSVRSSILAATEERERHA
jgi:hypothetical protein